MHLKRAFLRLTVRFQREKIFLNWLKRIETIHLSFLDKFLLAIYLSRVVIPRVSHLSYDVCVSLSPDRRWKRCLCDLHLSFVHNLSWPKIFSGFCGCWGSELRTLDFNILKCFGWCWCQDLSSSLQRYTKCKSDFCLRLLLAGDTYKTECWIYSGYLFGSNK